MTSVTDPAGRVVQYAYDLADRVTTQTRPDLQPIGLAYDANGNVRAVTPTSRPAHEFGYTPVDLKSRYDPPAVPGVTTPATTYAYNRDRQPTVSTRPDGQTLSVGYDPGGRVSTLTVPTGILRYAYAPTTGQLTTVTAPDGGTLTYTYDGGLVLGEAWGGPAGALTGRIDWTYDADFRVTSESVNGLNPVSFAYDADSLLTQAGALTLTRDPQTGFLTGTTLGTVTDSRTYTTFGEAQTYEAQVSGSPVYAVQYTRDALGRITTKTETVEGVTTVYGYRYDLAGRLDQVTTDGVVTATYTYNANGNRLTKTTPVGTETGTSDAQDRLTSYGGTTYTYTANGELATKTDGAGTTTYTYDLAGNLMAVQLPDGRLIEYLIDGQHRRIGKKVNGTLVQGWLYRGQLKPVAEIDGIGTVVARFVYGANPLVPAYMIKAGTTYRILTDHLGSPRRVVDTTTGLVVQRRDYDEWGMVTSDTNPGFQPFGFAGGLDDPDTRLVRFGARDFDPEIGRWTAKEPLRFEDEANLYVYATGDPVNRGDANGLKTYVLVTFAGGAGVGPVGAEGGQFYAVDIQTGKAHIFRYGGLGPSVGIPTVNGALTVEIGAVSFCAPNEITRLGWAVSGFAAAGHGAAFQASGIWSTEDTLRAAGGGYAYGAGASVTALVTWTKYMGEANVADLPQQVRDALASTRIPDLGSRR